MSKKMPLGVMCISVFHILAAVLHLFVAAFLLLELVRPTLFKTFDPMHMVFIGIFCAYFLVIGLLSGAIGIGLMKGKRMALFGAITIAGLNVFSNLSIGLMGVEMFWGGLVFHGLILVYLTMSKDVRSAFRA